MTISLPPAQGPSAASGSVVDTVAVNQAGLKEGPGGFWRDVFRRLRRNPTAWIGAGIVLVFILVSVLAPILAPYPERSTSLRRTFQDQGSCPSSLSASTASAATCSPSSSGVRRHRC